MIIIIVIAIAIAAIFIYNKHKSKNIRLKFSGLEYIDDNGKKFSMQVTQTIIIYDHTVVLSGYLNNEYKIVNFKKLGSYLELRVENQTKTHTLIIDLQIEQAYFFEESLEKNSYLFSNSLYFG